MADVMDARWDFVGGLDTQSSADRVARTRLRNAQNARLNKWGAIEKIAGSQRLHTDQIASNTGSTQAMIQWVPDSGTPQVVAIQNGKLYFMNEGSTTFTEVTPTTAFNTSNPVRMVPYKNAGSSYLYIIDGQSRLLYWWDGTSTIGEGTNVLPSTEANPVCLGLYKDRMFAGDGSGLGWSDVNDPQTAWTGHAFVETFDGEDLIALKPAGDSFLMFKNDSISRYTGVTPEEVAIATLTSGVSADHGCIAPLTVCHFEGGVFFLSDDGPYIANQAGIKEIGALLLDQWASLDQDNRANAVAVDLRRRKEIWLLAPSNGSAQNDTGWIWNYRLDAWTGPISLSYAVRLASRFERADGTESIMVCGYDSRIRDQDIETYGALDDVLVDGTGGNTITMIVEFPTLFFENPTVVKTLLGETQELSANLGAAGALTVTTSSNVLTTALTLSIATKGDLVTQYQFRPYCYGERITLKLTEPTSEITLINAIQLAAGLGRGVV